MTTPSHALEIRRPDVATATRVPGPVARYRYGVTGTLGGSPGREVASKVGMSLHYLYWRIAWRLGAACLREWVSALASQPRAH